MADDGIDISHKVPQSVFDLYRAGKTYAYVITVCSREAEENCPVFPGPVRRLSWPFPDPSQFTGTDEEILQRTIEVRNVIREEVKQFVEHYRAQHAEGAHRERQTARPRDLHPQQRPQPDDRGVSSDTPRASASR